MQIYRDLDVLTARPSAAEMARVPHHLVGVADAAETWSVGRWLTAATAALNDIAGRGKPAIVVGGTGLYFNALIRGLAHIPNVPEALRRSVEARLDGEGEATFRAILRKTDPDAEARIASGDRQRLIRAAAVFVASGRALSAWQADTRPALPAGAWRGVALEPPRDALYARCDARLRAMLDQGALDEVRALLARDLDLSLPAMKAVGVREFAAHLRGETSLDQALERARQETRRYAKRQLTWFRNQTPDWARLDALEPEAQWGQFLALEPALTCLA